MRYGRLFLILLIPLIAIFLSGCSPKAGLYQSEDGTVLLEVWEQDDSGDVYAFFRDGYSDMIVFLVYDNYFQLCDFSREENGNVSMEPTEKIRFDTKKDTISFTLNDKDYDLTLTD